MSSPIGLTEGFGKLKVAKQVALIARWHAKAVDLGTQLLALSCFDHNRFVERCNAIEDDVMSFQSLDLEFTAEVIDVLHEYCFILRKLIERTDKVEQAKQLLPHAGQETATIDKGGIDDKEMRLCTESLWWILGRIIHSRAVMVLGGDASNLIVYADGKTREYSDGRCYVEVSSDFDDAGQSHVIHVPSLVRAYMFSAMSREIQEIVRANTLR